MVKSKRQCQDQGAYEVGWLMVAGQDALSGLFTGRVSGRVGVFSQEEDTIGCKSQQSSTSQCFFALIALGT